MKLAALILAAALPLWSQAPAVFPFIGGTGGGSGGGGSAGPASVTVSTSGPVTVASAGYYVNNSAGALTYTMPSITSGTVGNQYCFLNAVTVSGAITLTAPASTSIVQYGAAGTTAGTLVSSGGLGDASCLVAIDTTHYYAYIQLGSWINN